MSANPPNPNIDPIFEEPVWLFPFEGMDIGESFFVPTVKPAAMVTVVLERARAAKCRVRVMTVSYEGYLGVRVWKIR